MGPGPKDAATLRALEKLSILLCDKGRDQGGGFIVRDGHERDIAVRTAIPSLVVHIKIDLEILVELTQLFFEVIADDEGVTTTKDLALCQVPVACEQPQILAEHAFDQHIVCDHLFVSRVVAENAQPARKATEHRISHEAYDRLWAVEARP